ncbi:hypothetical protein P171DRAFT_247155 [Karstenula rhodostoma CBS 690.94]|uniref:Uncharacterized protein n=1 Tax=Karstenula rhodostoma CBS 690.94 TaxID=1392251 RepID=A0A9P4PQS2_9PLEO|nr:hypothetical protein P171DRAFT_247155 [Karstenula rhodostoma CBS 690.94]
MRSSDLSGTAACYLDPSAQALNEPMIIWDIASHPRRRRRCIPDQRYALTRWSTHASKRPYSVATEMDDFGSISRASLQRALVYDVAHLSAGSIQPSLPHARSITNVARLVLPRISVSLAGNRVLLVCLACLACLACSRLHSQHPWPTSIAA